MLGSLFTGIHTHAAGRLMKTRACKEDAATVTQHHAPETATEGPHIRQLKSDSREPEWCRRGAVRVVCYFSWKCLPAFLPALPATSWPPYASFHRSSRHVAAQSPEFLLADATCQNLLTSALQHSRHHGAYSAPGMEEARVDVHLGTYGGASDGRGACQARCVACREPIGESSAVWARSNSERLPVLADAYQPWHRDDLSPLLTSAKYTWARSQGGSPTGHLPHGHVFRRKQRQSLALVCPLLLIDNLPASPRPRGGVLVAL